MASSLIFHFTFVPSGFCFRFNGHPLLSFIENRSKYLRGPIPMNGSNTTFFAARAQSSSRSDRDEVSPWSSMTIASS